MEIKKIQCELCWCKATVKWFGEPGQRRERKKDREREKERERK